MIISIQFGITNRYFSSFLYIHHEHAEMKLPEVLEGLTYCVNYLSDSGVKFKTCINVKSFNLSYVLSEFINLTPQSLVSTSLVHWSFDGKINESVLAL